jgi:hypothetical protein
MLFNFLTTLIQFKNIGPKYLDNKSSFRDSSIAYPMVDTRIQSQILEETAQSYLIIVLKSCIVYSKLSS